MGLCHMTRGTFLSVTPGNISQACQRCRVKGPCVKIHDTSSESKLGLLIDTKSVGLKCCTIKPYWCHFEAGTAAILLIYSFPICVWRVYQGYSQHSVGDPLHYSLNSERFFWVWKFHQRKSVAPSCFSW